MKNFQAVAFFDLDGTLLDAQSQITPEITRAIHTLKKNNILPLIATGRTLCEIKPIMQKSGIDSAIVMNGQFIHVDGKTIYSNEFSLEDCLQLLNRAQDLGHEVAYYNSEEIWCSGHNQLITKAYDFIHSKPPIVNLDGAKSKPVNMMLVISEDGDSYYREYFPEMTFYRNGPFSIDVVKKGISKGSGVDNLFKSLELPVLPTFAFGDGVNDLDLFKACDTTIAMGNARPELKELATFITRKNTDGGIVHALKHFDLI